VTTALFHIGIFLTLMVHAPAAVRTGADLNLFPASLRFSVPKAEDLDRGYLEGSLSSPAMVSIQVNGPEGEPWNLYLVCEHPLFFPADLDKPFHHLAWKFRNEPSGRYRPLEIGRQYILSGRSAARVELDFRFYVDWSDPPADYTMEILFEVERERSVD
jgi:hypothetical protein